LIYYSFIKSKYITKSIFIFKIYKIIIKIDIIILIIIIIIIIIWKFGFSNLLIIISTDLYLFYKYFIKFRIMKKKYLIINIIVF